MIITKEWLSQWIDIRDIDSEKIVEALNSIGLEVDSLEKVRIPKDVVAGKVVSCEKHPDADKLNVCKVDLGNKIEQIVCGAKNVAVNQMVAVAKAGSVLPGDMKIKKAKLRGVASNGMICSSTELGLPKINDGIMVLDESIGKLEVGKELSDYPLLNDDVIELELTANRGDCLSLHGVARDLSVPFCLDVKSIEKNEEEDNRLGIGRVLNVACSDKIDSSFIFKVFDNKKIESNLLIDLRVALVGESDEDPLQRLLTYATYSTGVLFRAYNYESLTSKNDKVTLNIVKQANDIETIVDKEIISYVGISQVDEFKADKKSKRIILEANYSNPDLISENTYNKKLNSDRHLYRSSRGSEPDLDFGMNYIIKLLGMNSDIMVYAGSQQVVGDYFEETINVHLDELNKMIGEEISKNTIVDILKRLDFDVVFNHEQETMNIKVPKFRHDIVNKQDICEEIVRMVGIDNIQAKPLIFAEKDKHGRAYINFKKRQTYRYKASNNSFFESMHFIFDDKDRSEKYGLETVLDELDLSNPITNELNSLRTSLIPNILESVSKNIKYGRRTVALFEIGTVFNKKREESSKVAFVFSGEQTYPDITNHGKPQEIDFYSFARKISNIIGKFDLIVEEPENNLSNPYEYAIIKKDGVKLGYISRLHSSVEKDFDLYKTYICEVDFNKLPFDKKIVKPYSNYQAISRDLSLLIPDNIRYSEISEVIKSLDIEDLVEYSVVDLYKSEELGDNRSLTIKFNFRSHDKTLKDEDISSAIENILNSLRERLDIHIR